MTVRSATLARFRRFGTGLALALLGAPAAVLPLGSRCAAVASDYFEIKVVDGATGRGVPLVELRTTNNVRYYTDSNGIAAVGDPELMGRTVYFTITSPGYHVPADSFGYTGTALAVRAGGKAVVKIARDNIAERLYRITGAGIYRDSVLTGEPVPIAHPLIDGDVMGQDTVEVTPYKGRLYWFFGDTDRPSYPLGQFATSGATSLLPGQGGLDPARGVDLDYWVGKDGFSRPMIPLPNAKGPVWIAGLFTLTDGGKERLYTHFAEVDHQMHPVRVGLARFDDAKAVFEPVRFFDPDNALTPEGHPFQAVENGKRYLYFQPPRMGAYPLTRVLADIAHVSDPARYEAFTCLAPGARYAGADSKLDRDGSGRLVWGWKQGTQPLGIDQVKDLVAAGKLKPDEALAQLRDVLTGDPVMSHGGSVFWNPYRRRWILITTQAFGKPSYLGEVWFSEADTPVGPWVYARKIVTHDHYTFYNPTQHPFFDQDGGRLVYFEGTYTNTFSDVKDITPRYNYNQLMYRLDLSDPRLALPEPVYRTEDGGYVQREGMAKGDWAQVRSIPFFAVPAGRRGDGLVPIYGAGGGLTADRPEGAKPLFYALPAEPGPGEKPQPDVAPLYEYRDGARRRYAVDDAGQDGVRSPKPLCRVWRNPSSVTAFDFGAAPAPPGPAAEKTAARR